MAELDFILSNHEYDELINSICDTKGILIPSLWYQKPEYHVWNSTEDIYSLSEQLNGPIFITWDSISKYPLKFDRVERKDGIFYFLSQGTGGPYLSTCPWIKRIPNSKSFIVRGDIHYHQKYWISELNRMIEVPEVLKDMYKQITKYIHSISKKIKTVDGKRFYWIGKEALKMLKEGASAGIELQLPE